MYEVPYVHFIRKEGGVELYNYTFLLMEKHPLPQQH